MPALDLTRRHTFAVNPETMQTSIPHVFAAGDAVSGPATVIEAVAAGHKAVAAIQRFLDGRDLDEFARSLATQPTPGSDWADIPEDITPLPRVQPAHTSGCGPGDSPLTRWIRA